MKNFVAKMQDEISGVESINLTIKMFERSLKKHKKLGNTLMISQLEKNIEQYKTILKNL